MVHKDLLLMTGKAIDNSDFYFGDLFAYSEFYIYTVCSKSSCSELLGKMYKLSKYLNLKQLEQETTHMKLGYELKVSPECLGIYTSGPYHVIIMQRFGEGTLTDLIKSGYYEKNMHTINSKIKHILDVLYDNHLDHNDLHSDNLLYAFNGDAITLKIIDFDKSLPFNSNSTRNYIVENRHDFTADLNVSKSKSKSKSKTKTKYKTKPRTKKHKKRIKKT